MKNIFNQFNEKIHKKLYKVLQTVLTLRQLNILTVLFSLKSTLTY